MLGKGSQLQPSSGPGRFLCEMRARAGDCRWHWGNSRSITSWNIISCSLQRCIGVCVIGTGQLATAESRRKMGPSGLEMEGDKMLSARGFLQWRHQDLRKAIMITMTPFYRCSHGRSVIQCEQSRVLRVAYLREAGISIRSRKRQFSITDKSESEHTLSPNSSRLSDLMLQSSQLEQPSRSEQEGLRNECLNVAFSHSEQAKRDTKSKEQLDQLSATPVTGMCQLGCFSGDSVIQILNSSDFSVKAQWSGANWILPTQTLAIQIPLTIGLLLLLLP